LFKHKIKTYFETKNMIRFLNLKNQICPDSNDFAFYDTISNTILSFGPCSQQVFDSIEDFKLEYEDGDKYGCLLDRFLSLTPDDYFTFNGKRNRN